MLHLVYVEAKDLKLHIQIYSEGNNVWAVWFGGKWEVSPILFWVVHTTMVC